MDTTLKSECGLAGGVAGGGGVGAFGRTPPGPADLRRSVVRGGVVTFGAQAIKLVLNLGSTLVLARLLAPGDYGLVGMVTAVTGFLAIFKDGGLSMSTVQRDQITEAQISTLFWLNVAIGTALALAVAALAPFLVLLYAEPRLLWPAVVLSGTFVLGGLTVQHMALLRRNLQFKELALVEILSLGAGVVTGIGMGLLGCAHWSLVGMAVASALVNVVAVWTVVPWKPGWPRRGTGVRPMLRFGGSLLGTRFVHTFVSSAPSILLGSVWGAATVGLYSRAYTLLMFAVEQIQGPVSAVALPPLARVQADTQRLRRVFIGCYSIVASAVLPVISLIAVFAEEVVALCLGREWSQAAPLLRWLAWGGLFVGLLHPQGILLLAMGRADRCLRLALLDSVCVLLAYLLGLSRGAEGMAFAFFLMKAALSLPVTVLTFRGTPVNCADILKTLTAPVLSCLVGVGVAWGVRHALTGAVPPWAILVVAGGAGALTYAALLLGVFKQWALFRTIVTELRPRSTPAGGPPPRSLPAP